MYARRTERHPWRVNQAVVPSPGVKLAHRKQRPPWPATAKSIRRNCAHAPPQEHYCFGGFVARHVGERRCGAESKSLGSMAVSGRATESRKGALMNPPLESISPQQHVGFKVGRRGGGETAARDWPMAADRQIDRASRRRWIDKKLRNSCTVRRRGTRGRQLSF